MHTGLPGSQGGTLCSLNPSCCRDILCISPMSGLLLKVLWITEPVLGQTEARSPELQAGLLCGWQGPTHSSTAPKGACWQEAAIRSRKLDLHAGSLMQDLVVFIPGTDACPFSEASCREEGPTGRGTTEAALQSTEPGPRSWCCPGGQLSLHGQMSGVLPRGAGGPREVEAPAPLEKWLQEARWASPQGKDNRLQGRAGRGEDVAVEPSRTALSFSCVPSLA